MRGDVLVVQTLLWSDEVRAADFSSLDEAREDLAKELDLSKQLVDSLVNDFEPEQYVDEYQQELRTLIAAKLEQGEAIDTAATFGEQPEEEKGGEVIDLMEALRQSIAAKREGGGKESGSGSSRATGTAKKGAAGGEKKPAAKKTPAKSTAAKKRSNAKPTRSAGAQGRDVARQHRRRSRRA